MTGNEPPTHHCAECSEPLWDYVWPYALCKACGQKPCKHGHKHGECATCDADSDAAYDRMMRGA